MFSELDSLISVVCSVLALASTCYFWFIRSNQERPSLSVFCPKPMTGAVLMPQEDHYPFQQLIDIGDRHWACFGLRLVVCNRSILGNSIVSMRVHVCTSDGKWEPAHFRLLPPQDESGSPANADFPVNLAPCSTNSIDGLLYLPASHRGATRRDRELAAQRRLHAKQRLKVELHCTEGGHFQMAVDVTAFTPDPLIRPTKQAA